MTSAGSGGPPLVKVRLHDRGEDVETPWAVDLGPVPEQPGARRVRLDNVPFLHAKPTYGDEIVVVPDEDGFLAWDRGGVPFARIGSRLVHDSRRWVMILDWTPSPGRDPQDAWRELVAACDAAGCVAEGVRGPDARRAGRVYVAVPPQFGVEGLLERLRSTPLPMDLELVHPLPD
jgi:hypothetical protein